MRTFPPEVILSWPTPNYINPETRGNALLAVNCIFIVLVIVVVALRLYTRIWIKRWFGSDDAFILLALLSTIGLTTTVLLANRSYGWDRHVYDIPFNKLTPTSKIAMSAKVMFTTAATFTRLSLLFFYYRLVQDSGKKLFLWTVHANVGFNIGIFLSFIFLTIFQCTPVKNYWIFGSPADTCLNEGTVTLAAGVINCVADFSCTVTPIPLVAKLQMPRRQRIAAAILFSLGFIVTIAGIVRTWYIYKSLIAEYDQTWYAYPLWIAAAIEVDLGVICASAPVLRPLLGKIPFSLASIRTSTSSKLPGSGRYLSKGSGRAPSEITLQGSKDLRSKSLLDSKRASQPVGILPEDGSQGQNYELKQWDAERGPRTSIPSIGSQDAILRNGDAPNGQDRRHSWRITTTDLNNRGITPTSEQDGANRLEPTSTRSSEVIDQPYVPLPKPESGRPLTAELWTADRQRV